MTEYGTVQNLTASPVLIDDEGHSLGAGEFGPAAVRTERVRALIREQRVAVVTTTAGDSEVSPEYARAHRQTEELRAEQAADEPADAAPSDEVAAPRSTRRRAPGATTEES